MLIQPMPITLPVKNPGKVKVTQVAAGRAHTLALTNENEVLTIFVLSYQSDFLKGEDYYSRFFPSEITRTDNVDERSSIRKTSSAPH